MSSPGPLGAVMCVGRGAEVVGVLAEGVVARVRDYGREVVGAVCERVAEAVGDDDEPVVDPEAAVAVTRDRTSPQPARLVVTAHDLREVALGDASVVERPPETVS